MENQSWYNAVHYQKDNVPKWAEKRMESIGWLLTKVVLVLISTVFMADYGLSLLQGVL